MPKFDVTNRIKELCNAYSWTYYRLAKESDITYSTLSTMLNKGTIPSIPTLEKICDGFGISLAQFFSEDSVAATLTEEQRLHLIEWNKLSGENKVFSERFIHFLNEEQS